MYIAFEARAPQLANSAWTAPGAILIGDVEVADGSSIWYGTVIRADGDRVTVGQHTNVQDAAVIHADPGLPVTIGDRVSVGHGAVLHGCTVDDDVLIGMGAKVLNGARIRSGSLIGAGAVVLEGTDVPAGSLVAGVPAKVRRATTGSERRHIASNAQNYVDLAIKHAAATAGCER
jgi:carbonic anhydrase/acetyltransferase-like protein (isoleucine patch superfamily)